MELVLDTIDTPPLDSASVVLLRQGVTGLEVLLMRRHQASRVLGGAFVFPGGKLDPEDQSAAALARLSESPQALHQRLAEPALSPQRAAGLFMAALREVFEECGVLLGTDPAQHQATGTWSERLADRPWALALADNGLSLHTSALCPWSRWVTPRQPSVTKQRFDTRFFLAPLQAGQQPRHDNHETTATLWRTPAQALHDYVAGRIDLAPPQIMSLFDLAAHPTVEAALQEARSRPPVHIAPEPFDEGGRRTICYPGDPRHSQSGPRLRGPSRLHFEAGRFVPDGGWGTWLPTEDRA